MSKQVMLAHHMPPAMPFHIFVQIASKRPTGWPKNPCRWLNKNELTSISQPMSLIAQGRQSPRVCEQCTI